MSESTHTDELTFRISDLRSVSSISLNSRPGTAQKRPSSTGRRSWRPKRQGQQLNLSKKYLPDKANSKFLQKGFKKVKSGRVRPNSAKIELRKTEFLKKSKHRKNGKSMTIGLIGDTNNFRKKKEANVFIRKNKKIGQSRSRLGKSSSSFFRIVDS